MEIDPIASKHVDLPRRDRETPMYGPTRGAPARSTGRSRGDEPVTESLLVIQLTHEEARSRGGPGAGAMVPHAPQPGPIPTHRILSVNPQCRERDRPGGGTSAHGAPPRRTPPTVRRPLPPDPPPPAPAPQLRRLPMITIPPPTSLRRPTDGKHSPGDLARPQPGGIFTHRSNTAGSALSIAWRRGGSDLGYKSRT